MVSTYSNTRRNNAIKALFALLVLVAIILIPRVVKADMLAHLQLIQGQFQAETSVAFTNH